jgi:putative transposase
MPRKLRVGYPGAIYHVMSRGGQREDILLDDVDCHDFIKTLAEACQKTDWQIDAFCLMSNHYHLVLEAQGCQDESPQIYEQLSSRNPPTRLDSQ